MLPTCYCVTSSAGKIAALRRIIPTMQHVDYDLVEIQELDPKVIIAAKLEEAVCKRPELVRDGSVCIVEDTSLYFDAFKNHVSGARGLPGPLIKWFLKTLGSDGLYEFAIREGSLRAQAVTLIGCRSSNGQTFFVEGSVQGTLVKPRGSLGFGWDSLFKPDGSDKTFAEMTEEEREQASMRTIAVQLLKKQINKVERYRHKLFVKGMVELFD